MSKPNIVLDASQLDTLQSCEAKFDFRYNKNKITPRKAPPLDRGGVMHESLQRYYENLQKGVHFNDANEAMLSRFNETLADSDLDSDMISIVRRTLIECVEYWRHEDEFFRIEDVEKPFLYLLAETEEIKLYMAGKVDLVISNKDYFNLPYDHKSFQYDRGVRRLNNQFINYCHSVGSNVLYVNRIGLYADNSKKKPEEKFKRVPMSYDKVYIQQWIANTVKWAERYVQNYAEDKWIMNLTSCDKYNRLCEYYDVCDSSGQEAKIFKLEALFNTGEPWDVSKILERPKSEGE